MLNFDDKNLELLYIGLSLFSAFILLVVAGSLNLSWHEGLFLMAVGLILFMLVLRPWGGFLLLLFVRPSIDIYGGRVLFEGSVYEVSFNVVLGLVVLVWGSVFLLSRFSKVRKDPRFFWILAFVVLSFFSLFYSVDPRVTLREAMRVAGIFTLSGVGFLLVRDKKRLQALAYTILASLVFPLAEACYQFFTGTGKIVSGFSFQRLYGTLFHPNSLAFLLVLGIGIAFSFYSRTSSRKKRSLYALFGIFAFLIILGTYTRGAWLGLFFFVGLYGIFYARKFLLGLAGAGLLLFIFVEPLRMRILDLLQPALWGSILWRFKMWQGMLPYLWQNPVIGSGLGTFKVLAERVFGQFMWSYEAHNDYLRLGIEVGFLGLFLYLGIYIKSIWVLARTYLKNRKVNLASVYFGGAVLLLAFLLMSFGDNVLRGTALQWALWSYTGGLLGVLKKDEG